MNLPNRAREQGVLSDFRHRLLVADNRIIGLPRTLEKLPIVRLIE